MNDQTQVPGSGAVGYTESINQPTKIRLSNGAEVAITDWSWRKMYSVVDVLSGATNEELYTFNYVEGDQVSFSANIGTNQRRTATIKDCNNKGKSQMPSEQEYICYAVAIQMWQFDYETTDDDDATLTGEDAYLYSNPGGVIANSANMSIAATKLIFSLEITEKDFFTGDPTWFSQGGGPFLTSSGGAGGNLRTYALNGLQTKDAIDRAPVPLHIGGTEEFKGILYNQDGLPITWLDEQGLTDTHALIRFKVEMIGLHKRPAG